MNQALQQPTSERVYFDDGATVRITSARAVVLGTTYALANITSVRVTVEPRSNAWLIWGALFAVGGMLLIGSSGGVGFCLIALGVACIANYIFRLKDKHWVCLGTAGAEQQAIYYTDPAHAQQMVAAMNDAIISRG